MKRFILGLLIGTILATAGSAIAQVDWGKYQGLPIARLMIDGAVKNPAEPAFILKGRTYVPLRYISEALGATVDWDQTNRTVLIISPPKPDVAPITTQPTTQPIAAPQATYQNPPISTTNQGVTLTLTSVQADASGTNLYVTIENNSNVDVRFPASLTQLVAGNTQFNQPLDYDYENFGDDLHPGVTKSGVIKFPALPSGTTQVKVYFKVWPGGVTNSFEPVFSVQL